MRDKHKFICTVREHRSGSDSDPVRFAILSSELAEISPFSDTMLTLICKFAFVNTLMLQLRQSSTAISSV